MKPEELLELFSIDQYKGGGVMFRSFVWDMVTGSTAQEAAAALCREVHMPRPAVFYHMKRALGPVFDADPETLKALGLRHQSTTIGLAQELIRSMKGGEGDV